MNRLSSSTSTPAGEGGKSRLRMGLDWFQSQLLSADGISQSNSQKRRHKRGNQCLREDGDIHRIQINTDKNTIHDTIGLDDYTDGEYRDTFYDGEDLKLIFERTRKIVVKMETGEIDARVCTRGLDKLYGERQEACRNIRSKSINAVMDLQEEQWETESDDFEALAKASRQITIEAAKRAIHEARQDIRAAQSHLQDVDTSQWAHPSRNTKTTTETKSILKTQKSTSDLRAVQSLFPESRSTTRGRDIASSHDQRMTPLRTKSMPGLQAARSSSTPPVHRGTREERKLAASANTPMQRAKDRLVQPPVTKSQTRRQTIATALENASKESQEIEKVKHRPTGYTKGNSQPNSSRSALSDSSHSEASFAGEDHKSQSSRRILRSNSGGVLGSRLTNSFHQRKSALKEVGDEDEIKITKSVDKKRVLPKRSTSAVGSNAATSSRSLQLRRTCPPPTNNDEIVAGTGSADNKKRAPPQRSNSDALLGMKKSNAINQPRSSLHLQEGNKTMSTNESGKNRAPPQRSKSGLVAGAKIRRLSHTSKSEDDDIAPVAKGSTQEKVTQKRTPPQPSKSGLVAGAKIRRFSRTSVSENDEILTVTESSDERTNVKKKMLPRRSITDLRRRTDPSDSDEIVSESESSTKGAIVKKRTPPQRSMSEHHGKNGSSDDNEIVSLEERSSKGMVVKKRAPPQRSASAANFPSGKPASARAPPRERPE